MFRITRLPFATVETFHDYKLDRFIVVLIWYYLINWRYSGKQPSTNPVYYGV